MIATPHQTRQQCGCHGNLTTKSFPFVCRFLPRQMLACLCALKSVSAKAGPTFEVMA